MANYFFAEKSNTIFNRGYLASRFGTADLTDVQIDAHRIFPLIDAHPGDSDGDQQEQSGVFNLYEKGPIVVVDRKAIQTYRVNTSILEFILGSTKSVQNSGLFGPATGVLPTNQSYNGSYTSSVTSATLPTSPTRRGSGLTFTVTTDSNGFITECAVVDAGDKYLGGEYVTVDTSSIGGVVDDEFQVLVNN